jgi:putative ABC transport system ATP-binding protein
LSKIIQATDISKTITKKNQCHILLPSCSIDITEGDMVALTGESGIGKSTLLNILGCLDAPSTGKYFLGGHPIHAYSTKQKALIRKRTFGYIFQQYWLIKHLTVLENVALSLHYAEQKATDIDLEAKKALETVGLLSHQAHYPMQLSGGQQQRACIARAIITKPKIIIADEPTGALDQENSKQVMSLLRDINNNLKTTVLIVTHDQKIASLCNKHIPITTLFTQQ